MITPPDIASLLSGEEVSLPYSGTYRRPSYQPGSSPAVHGYDIGGTLADARERDSAIRAILSLPPDADIKNCLFVDEKATKRISRAQEEGIMAGNITVDALDGVVEQLTAERERGEDCVLITVGTYQMARSFMYGAGLGEYVTALTTSEEARTGNTKTAEMFLRVYDALKQRGKTLVTYCDDTEQDALAAVEAGRIVQDREGSGFTVFLIRKDAEEHELGRNKAGYVVIRSVREKHKWTGENNE